MTPLSSPSVAAQLLRRSVRHLQEEPPAEEEGLSIIDLALAVGVFLLMIGVGSSCKWVLFKKMFSSPKAIKAAAVGVLCQFFFMPVVALTLTKIFQINGYSALGMVMAGTMPGGSISNIFTMWYHGILELSVFMTIVSTITAFGMTPLWLYIFTTFAIDFPADETGNQESPVAVDQIALTLVMLIIPLAIGISLNCCTCSTNIQLFLEKGIHILAIIFFVGVIVGLLIEYSAGLAEHLTWQLVVAAVIYFPIAAGLSYGLTTVLKFPPAVRRTVVLEVGIQNLALGFAIGEQAMKYNWQKEQAIPFPLMYAICMYSWGFLLMPFFRRQKRLNDDGGIVDLDSDFFLVDETDNKDEPVAPVAAKDVAEEGEETENPNEETAKPVSDDEQGSCPEPKGLQVDVEEQGGVSMDA